MKSLPRRSKLQIISLHQGPIRFAGLEEYRRLLLPAVYIPLVAGLVFYLFPSCTYDDPYITYRYAQNLARGAGFVYNPGESVLSTTTPLFAILLAGLVPLGLSFPVLANAIGAASLASGGFILWIIGRKLKTPIAGLAGLLLYPFFPTLQLTLGSETPFYLALSLAAIALYLHDRYLLAAVLVALAVLARPDAVLVALILSADYLLRIRRPVPWRAAGAAAVILAIWAVLAWLYFGSPVPVTLAAKQSQGSMQISSSFLAGFLRLPVDYSPYWHYRFEALLAILGLAFLVRRSSRWAMVVTWSALYVLAYAALGLSSYYWYYAPLAPGFTILAGLGLEAVTAIRSRGKGPERGKSWPKPALSWQTSLALTLLAGLSLLQMGTASQLKGYEDPRFRIYRSAGRWLARNTPPSASAGALEVGIIGYFSGRPMVDFAGLIQPAVARQIQATSTYIDTARWAIREYQPDYLVLQDGDYSNLITQAITEKCLPVRHFYGPDYGSPENLTIFACEG